MLVRMSRVAVLGTKRLREPALSFLHDLGVLHLEEPPPYMGEVACAAETSVAPAIERLRARKRRLESMGSELPLAELPGNSGRYGELVHLPLEGFEKALDHLAQGVETECRPLLARKRLLEQEGAELARLLGYLAVVGPLVPLLRPLERHETALLVVEARFAALPAEIERQAGELAEGRVELFRVERGSEIGALLVFPSDLREAVRGMIAETRVSQVQLPEFARGVDAARAESRLRTRRARVEREAEWLQRRILRSARKWRPLLGAALPAIDDRIDELHAVCRLGQTDRAFVLCGWMPTARTEEVCRTVEERFEGRVMVTDLPASAGESRLAPVALSNPAAIRPFEAILDLLGPPRYGSIDPTPLLALFFVAFFGLIVGDIAYGGLIVATALLLRRRAVSPLGRALTGILAYGGVSAILFGLLYGEFLGDMLYRMNAVTFVEIAGIRLPVERENLILPLFFLSLGLGLAHLLLGLVLGVVSAGRSGERKLAAERLGEIGLLAGLVLFAGMAWGWIPHLVHHTAYGLVILGSLLLLYASGPLLGPLHALELFRSLLSYLRLAALALAGMSLAAMANHLGGAVGNLAFGVLLAVLLHALNLGFSIVSPAIHSLRLNVLEFFSGFYEPGGRPYRPFQRTRG